MASNSIIQYSSSSSCNIIETYDVFVSFRGDTRNNFTDHLFGALRRKGIRYFSDVDDRKLKKGKHILPELLQAIDGSQILVVVFSREYASSKWCLRELEKIASCINVEGKRVLPIFYDVTPTEVRNQGGEDYKRAFDDYEERFKEDKEKMEEVQRWREALSQVANLSGWDIGNKSQYGEIEKIVQNIQKISQQNMVSSSNDDLVGIEYAIEKLKKLLLLDSDDIVLSLGICGLAGMGKTTLIRTLYDRIYHYFEFPFFVEDVNSIFQNSDILGLRKQLLCQDPEEKGLEIYNVSLRTNFVSYGRRLIILDNVGHIEHLEKLNLNNKCLSPDSRIIIISKDRRILEYYGVNSIYHVRPLHHKDAIQLFCKYAFKGNCVMSEYEKLKYDVLPYLQGHPLLIKVLGRHLADQSVSQWRNALVKLRENPKKDILDKLRISFDDLEQNEKEIFLDFACFSDWYQGNNVFEVLRFRGFEPVSGLNTLIKKSLVAYFSETRFHMQGLLIDLGKYIVKEKSPKEPRKWSRLWDCQDLLKVLLDKKAPKNLEAIIVDCYPREFAKMMKVDALSRMDKLKLLAFNGVKFSGSLNDLSNELGYLFWKKYPFKCLPPNFQPNNLVKLVMQDSSIERLWKDTKALPNLKYLDLSHSKNLVKMPNFGEAQYLECLKFEGCIQLKKIHSSISVLKKLTLLNLKDCKSLVKMPHFGEALNLKWLNFGGCIKLREIHQSIGSLKELRELNLEDCINLVSLPTSLLDLSSLKYLNLSGCSSLYNTWLLEESWLAKHPKKPCILEAAIHSQPTSSIPKKSFMSSFPYMCVLDLSFCNLHQIPDAIGNLCCLERLNLKGNKFEKIPSLKKLSRLVYINLEHCKQLKYLFELPLQTHLTSGTYAPPLKIDSNHPSYWIREGLYIFNCTKLVGSEEWNRMSITWMTQMVKVSYPGWKSVESVIPGNEIPSWFNNHHMGMGNRISLNVTPLRQDDNSCIGIAFCVVFCMSHHNNNSVTKRNPPKRRTPILQNIPLLLDANLITDKSDHMYLFYFLRSKFVFVLKERRHLDFEYTEVEFRTAHQDWDFEVKKYGYCWIHEENLNLSSKASKHCKNSSNWKPKLSEIKEEQ